MQPTTTNTIATEYLTTALDAGYTLVRDAIWHENCCNWIGCNIAPSGGRYQIVKNSCSANVYSGISGIALFFAELTQQVNDVLLQTVFEGAMQTILSQKIEGEKMQYAYYAGQLGIADTLIYIGTLKGRQDYSQAGWEQLAAICKTNPSDNEIDIISGVAGAIPVLLKYYQQTKEKWLLEAAEKCGQFLLDKAEKTNEHYTWITMSDSPALTGYSHGNAGIALALLELYQITQQQHWLTAAMMGFQYERLQFDAKYQNWPDLRKIPGQTTTAYSCQEAWCHGAPGIALSRLRAWQITNDSGFLNEARTALHTTYLGLHRSQNNYSLCHGIAGNADVLLTAGMLLQEQTLVHAAREAGRLGIDNYLKNDIAWPTGVSDPNGMPGTQPNPSLLLGLAGTGYFYLRLAYPDKVRSVLMPNTQLIA